MPQWRKLHVKATESLDIHEMPDDFTRLLWVMLPLALDQHGRGIDSTAWVKAKAMPLRDDIDGVVVESALTWYADRGMIERYHVNGRKYFWIPTWYNHQGNTNREADSIYPAPPSWVAPEWVQGNGGNTPDNPSPNSRPTQEPVVSRSSPDVDTDVDVDTEREAEAEPAQTPAAQAPAPAPPTPKPRAQPRKKPQKPIPAAVQVFRKNAHRYPAKSWYADVAAAVGDDPDNLELWGKIVKGYVGQGWNPTNVSNMLEFYQRREIPSNDGKGKGNANSLRDRPAGFIGSATTAHDHNDPTPEEIAEFQAAVDAHARQRPEQAASAPG